MCKFPDVIGSMADLMDEKVVHNSTKIREDPMYD